MSTYLIAFTVGEMKYLESTTSNGTIVRTYATPDNIDYTKFALDTATKTLEYYNQYFDIEFPLPKCDFVALPDFSAGAMENWGMITFREQALLVDPKNTSLSLKEFVAGVIAHELTHQWFGNLVTMRWWNDLWLNESFASFMTYLAIDHLFPDWQFWKQFIIEEQSVAMKLDGLENTHPIEVSISHPDEIRSNFDQISYEKGASVLLMLHNYLGATYFKQGLRLYLKRHAYANTETIDLWQALEEVSEKPVRKFMNRWTSRPGYPIIHLDIKQKEEQTSLVVKQERFYLNRQQISEAEMQNTSWPVPLLPNEASLKDITLTTKQDSFKVSKLKPDFVLNHDRSSFVRVTYSSDHIEVLSESIKSKKLNELDRHGLLSDSFEAAKAGYIATADALKILSNFDSEDSLIVWETIASSIAGIRLIIDEDDEARKDLKHLVNKITLNQVDRLGWKEKPSDTHFDKLLRPMILGLASFGENKAVTEEAHKRFAAMAKPEDIHPDLRAVVYGATARDGGAKEFNKLVQMHDASTSSEERVTLSSAITGFQQQELIKKALDKVTTDTVRAQDVLYWIAYSFGNRFAKEITWEWTKSHWKWLEDSLGDDLSFNRIPVYAARVFSNISFLDEYDKFFESHAKPGYARAISQGRETIVWQSDWKTRDLEGIKNYLKTI